MNPYEQMGAPVPHERYDKDDEGVLEDDWEEEGAENPRESAEVTPFDQDAAIEKERGFLETMEGKAKKVAKVMALVSALSLGAGYGEEAYARDRDDTPRAEQVERSNERPSREERLTSAGRMFDRMVDDAREDMGKIQTAEDAEWLLRAHVDQFVSEYYIPSKGGRVRKDPYGVKVREYSEGDLHSILQNAKDMKNILNEIQEKYGIDQQKRSEQLDDMIQKVERRASYAGRMEEALMKQMEKQLGQFKIRVRTR